MKRRNNKKILIIIIGIILFIIALLVTYIILIVKEILPNPLLDTSDLVCDKVYYVGESINGTQHTFKFDKKANLINFETVYYYKYFDYEKAKEFYESYKDSNLIVKFDDDQNRIEITENTDIENNKDFLTKTKEEISKLYTEEYFYDCK